MNVVHILPNLRKGLSTLISDHDNLRATFNVNVRMKGHRAGSGEEKPSEIPGADPNSGSLVRPFLLAGPVDVQSVSEDAICQAVPEDKSAGFSNGYMPYIEFFDEDFPWRYTPLKSDEKLKPWLLLLACKDEEFTVEFDAKGFHRVTVDLDKSGTDPVAFYPAEGEFHMAAHVQITAPEEIEGQDENDLKVKLLEYVKEHPDDGVSRLFCLRVLEPYTHYTVFLVPAFELGRRAGLGEEISAQVDLYSKLSWDADAKRRTFPVYYQWSFTTGAEKFMELADKQRFISSQDFATLSPGLKADINDTGLKGYRLTSQQTANLAPIDIPAALVKKGYTGRYDRREPTAMDDELKSLLLKSPVFSDDDPEHPLYEDPWVVPPVYGARHILAKPEDLDKGNLFLRELNLRFSNRAVAGMGAQVVKKNQEQFMNRAWGMVEEVNALNQRVREFYQVLKTNGAADVKTTSLRYYNFPTAVFGLQADAAIRIANAQSAARVNAVDLANDVSGKNLNVMTSAMGDFSLGAGITWAQLQEICNEDNWEGKMPEIVKQGRPYKFYLGMHFYFEDERIPAKYQFLKQLFYVPSARIGFRPDGTLMLETRPHGNYFNFSTRYSRSGSLGTLLDALPLPGGFLGIGYYWALMLWICPSSISVTPADSAEPYYDCSLQEISRLVETGKKEYDHQWNVFNGSVIKSLENASLPIRVTVEKQGRPMTFRGLFLKQKAYETAFPDSKYENGVYVNVGRYGDGLIHKFFIMPESKLYDHSIWNYSKIYNVTYKDDGDLDRWDTIPLEFDSEGKCFRPVSSDLDPSLEEAGISVLSAEKSFIRTDEDTVDYSPGVGPSHEYLLWRIHNLWSYLEKGTGTVSMELYEVQHDGSLSYYYLSYNYNLKAPGRVAYNIHYVPDDNKLYLVSSNQWQNCLSIRFEMEDGLCWKKNGVYWLDLDRVHAIIDQAYRNLVWFDSIAWRPNYLTCEYNDLADLPEISADEVAGLPNNDTKLEKIRKEVMEVYEAVTNQVNELRLVMGLQKSSSQYINNASMQKLFEVKEKSVVDADAVNREKLIERAKDLSARKMSMDLMESNFDGKYPVMAAPIFPDPTSFYLRELSEKYILPSVDELKMNSISCFVTNPAFEEAFLAGMNTEMGRELLWREYPTDERGSCFRKFWDQDVLPDDFGKGYFDVKYMHNWKGRLGENHEAGKGKMTVFVIKSELMLQYPRTAVCLAVSKNSPDGEYLEKVLDPVMTGWLSDDTYLAGFKAGDLPSTEGVFLAFVETDKSQRFSRGITKRAVESVSSEFAVNRTDSGSVWGVEVHPNYLKN